MTASGSTMPVLAPKSVLRLQSVNRSSIAHRRDRFTAPFDGAVVGTVGAHLRDDVERQILGVHACWERAAHVDAHRLGNSEPGLPGGEHHADVGGPEAGREASEAAIGRAVRVGADDDATRLREPAIDHHLVTDSLPRRGW